jgi:hypothetical protein
MTGTHSLVVCEYFAHVHHLSGDLGDSRSSFDSQIARSTPEISSKVNGGFLPRRVVSERRLHLGPDCRSVRSLKQRARCKATSEVQGIDRLTCHALPDPEDLVARIVLSYKGLVNRDEFVSDMEQDTSIRVGDDCRSVPTL